MNPTAEQRLDANEAAMQLWSSAASTSDAEIQENKNPQEVTRMAPSGVDNFDIGNPFLLFLPRGM